MCILDSLSSFISSVTSWFFQLYFLMNHRSVLSENVHARYVLVSQLCPTLCDPMDCRSPARLLCPWNSPGKNIGVGSHSLLQEIFPTQGSNLGLLHYRQILYHLSHQGSWHLPLIISHVSPAITLSEYKIFYIPSYLNMNLSKERSMYIDSLSSSPILLEFSTFLISTPGTFFLFFFFLLYLNTCGISTREGIHAPCSRRAESHPLVHQRMPNSKNPQTEDMSTYQHHH